MTSPEAIGYFRVTNREFDKSLGALDLNEGNIIDLPKDAVIAEIGSGLDQNFAQGIKNLRSDIKVISLDPTLGLSKNDFFTVHTRAEDASLKQVSYTYGKHSYFEGKLPEYADSPTVSAEVKKERLQTAQRTGNVVSGLAPEIPFATESLDMIVDTWGPGLYLDRYEENSPLEIYLQNVVRALNQKGNAYIYPIDFYGESGEVSDIKNVKAKEEYMRILNNVPGINIEFYEYTDPAIENKDVSTRIGIKIKKL